MAFCSLSYVENFRLIQFPNIILKWIERGAKRRESKLFLFISGIVSIAEIGFGETEIDCWGADIDCLETEIDCWEAEIDCWEAEIDCWETEKNYWEAENDYWETEIDCWEKIWIAEKMRMKI